MIFAWMLAIPIGIVVAVRQNSIYEDTPERIVTARLIIPAELLPEIGLLLIFLMVMLGSGRLLSKMIRDAIGVNFANTELLAQLSESHSASRVANSQLNEQIYAQRVMQLHESPNTVSVPLQAFRIGSR